MLSKTLEPSEIGKGFGGVALVAAIMPFVNATVYQGVFRQTLDTFIHAIVLVNIAGMTLALFFNCIFFWRRKTMTCIEEKLKKTYMECKYPKNHAFSLAKIVKLQVSGKKTVKFRAKPVKFQAKTVKF